MLAVRLVKRYLNDGTFLFFELQRALGAGVACGARAVPAIQHRVTFI
jgi:hypothetical protein